MSREIKFRAWCNDTMYPGVWFQIVWLPTPSNRNNFVQKWFYGYDDNHQMLSDPVVMQCTGLEDSNGCEIYEGDILNYLGKRNCLVVFKHGRFCLQTNKGYYLSSLCIVINEPCEIIGNIHENPDLMEIDNG